MENQEGGQKLCHVGISGAITEDQAQAGLPTGRSRGARILAGPPVRSAMFCLTWAD